MAGPLDFTGQNIEDSYQRVLQTDGTIITDGTGSLVNLQFTGSFSGSFEGTISSASYATTASYTQQAESASYVAIGQGAGITVSGTTVTANLRTVNGNSPDVNGNVAVSLAAVLTGTSSSLASYATGGLAEGTVWIVSNDTADRNGDSYVYDSGSIGVWYQIAPLDQTAGDARYARTNTATIQNLTSSFARSASYAANGGVTQIIAGSGVSISPTSGLGAVTITNTGGGGGVFPYVGTAVITGSLIVSGSGSTGGTINLLSIGLGGGSVATNVVIGSSSLINNTTGFQNTVIGVGALSNTRIERNHTAIGFNAMQYASSSAGDTDYGNVAIGTQAGRYLTGSRNVAIGLQALYQTSGSGAQLSLALGYQALYGSGEGVRGNYNLALGYRSLYSANTAGNSVAIGPLSLTSHKTGDNNTSIGFSSMEFSVSSSDNTVIGRFALRYAQNVSRVVAIGSLAASNQWGYSSAVAADCVAIGYSALRGSTTTTLNTGTGNTAIGSSAMLVNTSGTNNVSIGQSTLLNNAEGSENIAIGALAAAFGTKVSQNTLIGVRAGYVATGSANVGIGYEALSAQWASTALNQLDRNTAIGYQAGRWISASSGNVFVGYQAGPSAVGSGQNTAKTTVNNKLFIANAPGNPLIGGDFTAKTVTISGSIYISGSIIPNTGPTLTSSFELGSRTAAWNRIWVRSGSVHFVDDSGTELAKISATPAGAIEMPSIYTAGTFTAQTFITQSTTYIVEQYYATGSSRFGSSSLDTHQFTGSVFISGGLQQSAGSTTLSNTTVNGNLTATQSVYLSGLQNSNQNYLVSINPSNGQLFYTASEAFAPANVDVSSLVTTGSNTFIGAQTFYDESQALAARFDSNYRVLYDDGGVLSLDWGTRLLRDENGNSSFNYSTRELMDNSGTAMLSYINNSATFPSNVKMTGLDEGSVANVITQNPTTGQLFTTPVGSLIASSSNKAGTVNSASFGGRPYSASVVFSTSYVDTNYSVNVTGEDLRTFTVSGKTASGFTINTNSTIALQGGVDWIAQTHNS